MIISICNEKGGVGKTTSTIQIASLLADAGHKTLMVDMDPQGHCGEGLGKKPVESQATILEVLDDQAKIKDVVVNVMLHLDLIPCNKRLARAEKLFGGQMGALEMLRERIEAIAKAYEFIVIDCAPSLGFLTLNALRASDYAVVPMMMHKLPFEGMKSLLNTVTELKARTPAQVKILGILPTIMEQTNVMRDFLAEVQKRYGKDMVFKPIPKTTKFAEAQCYSVPLQHYQGFTKDYHPVLDGYRQIVQTLEEKSHAKA